MEIIFISRIVIGTIYPWDNLQFKWEYGRIIYLEWGIVCNLKSENYMSCPPVGNETSLVGYWNFNEGSGNTVI